MYVGETQENWLTHPKGPSLTYHPQQKTKEDVGGGRVGASQERKANDMEMEKHSFGKQMFAGSCRDNGILSGLWSLGLPSCPDYTSPHNL